jgi:hypothetical protein
MVVNLQAAGIRRIADERENQEAIALALAPMLRRYPKCIKAIALEPLGEKSQTLIVQVEVLDMEQAGDMSDYLNNELLVQSGFTSAHWHNAESASDADAVTEGLLSSLKLQRATATAKRWWEFWK